MVTGIKEAPQAVRFQTLPRLGALLLMMAIASVSGVFYAWHEPVEQRLGHDDAQLEGPHVGVRRAKLRITRSGARNAAAAIWRSTPIGCRRDLAKLMAQQDQHFGTDLAAGCRCQCSRAGLHGNNAGSKAIGKRPQDQSFDQGRVTPLRITETPYWVGKHSEFPMPSGARPR